LLEAVCVIADIEKWGVGVVNLPKLELDGKIRLDSHFNSLYFKDGTPKSATLEKLIHRTFAQNLLNTDALLH
jgi:hypothetical protein